MFVDPMPSPEFLAAQYRSNDRPISEARYPFNKARKRRRRAMVRAARLYRHLRGKDVIDLGCGGGFMVEAMRRLGARAVGLDINPRAIAYATKNFPKCQFFCEDLERFEGRGLQFDFVHSSQVLEHVPDADDFVKRWSRITRPGGWAYIKTPDRGQWRNADDFVASNVPDPPGHVQFFNKTNLSIMFEKHGFEMRKIFFTMKPSLQLLARRR